jgi:hypothetical protein
MGKKYTVSEISKMFDKHYQTVNFRFNSPYADKRWGVIKETRPDGSIKKYVPEEKIHLWVDEENYVGKPVFEDDTTNKK